MLSVSAAAVTRNRNRHDHVRSGNRSRWAVREHEGTLFSFPKGSYPAHSTHSLTADSAIPATQSPFLHADGLVA